MATATATAMATAIAMTSHNDDGHNDSHDDDGHDDGDDGHDDGNGNDDGDDGHDGGDNQPKNLHQQHPINKKNIIKPQSTSSFIGSTFWLLYLFFALGPFLFFFLTRQSIVFTSRLQKIWLIVA